MPAFTVPNTTFQADVEFLSPPQLVNQTIQSVRLSLTDPGGQWPATLDTTRFLKCCGLLIERPGAGGDWRWYAFIGNTHDSQFLNDGATEPMPYVAGDSSTPQWVPFGTRLKNGAMPQVNLLASDVREVTGCRVRMGVISTATVTLGAEIQSS